MQVITNGELIEIHPTALDGKRIRYRLGRNGHIRESKVVRCRRDGCDNYLVVVEGQITTYDVRMLQELEILPEQ